MQMHDMPDDKHKGDHAGGTLERVADVADVRIGADVGQAPGNDHKPHGGMEQHRQKNEGPLDRHKQRPERMDHVHPRLKGPRSTEHRSVGQEVDHQERADGNEPRQREQAVDQKLVTVKKRSGRLVLTHARPFNVRKDSPTLRQDQTPGHRPQAVPDCAEPQGSCHCAPQPEPAIFASDPDTLFTQSLHQTPPGRTSPANPALPSGL